MTGFTQIGGVGMARRFAGCNRIVVTTGAGAYDLGVIHISGCHRRPTGWKHRVTGIALVSAVNVCCTFSTGRHTVVAGKTVTHKATVIHCRGWRPSRSVMTGIAFQ